MNLDAPLTDKANALECLDACELTYDKLCELQTDEAHCNIIILENCLLILFRGSYDPTDFVTDAECAKVITIYGQIHTGIWRSYLSIQPLVREKLRSLPALPIVIGGHSLGGSQCILCANDLSLSKFPIARVITFGEPREGDAEFASFYNPRLASVTVRWVNPRDVVPRMPFSACGYYHVGQEAFLTSAGRLQLNPTGWEMVHDDVVGMVDSLRSGNINILNDHRLSSYRSRIMALTQ